MKAKMKQRKISFLIAAHNEEKIIAKTLDNLLRLPYKDYEVLIGLDGCTDRTVEIVRDFCMENKKFKYYIMNLRQGKNAVINSIIKKAKGEIIIINDADWIFKTKDRESLEKFIALFDNPKMGGISESLPLEWEEDIMKNSNLGYRMVAYSSYLWYKFQKKKFAERRKGLLYVKEPALFITNIFRKKLYKENTSLSDDFERTKDIISQDYDVVISEERYNPKMAPVYNEVSIRDLFKQKIRTARAREQIKDEHNIKEKYYLSAILYILKNSWKLGINVGFMMIFWIFLTGIATIYSNMKKFNTKEGWTLRVKR
ncbi:glycosyltransferase [Candidatus Pacearchaeota archaeon]|nr:glycosyltransferase [Candidatus Pacearchaeota archaeon]